MSLIHFDYLKTSLIDPEDLNDLFVGLLPVINNIRTSITKQYDSPYACLYLPEDQILKDNVKEVSSQLLIEGFSALFIIGIGGSNLGTNAIFQALKGTYYNNLNPFFYFYSVDTVDNDYLKCLLEIAENELKKGKNIVLNIVTKSGNTTETIINASLFVNLLKKYRPTDYNKFVVVTTDKDSPLWKISKNKFNLLEIPRFVGGRYSVLSAVGLLPCSLLGINIDELLDGALEIRLNCLNESIEDNLAALSALITFYHFKRGKNISDLFLFSPDFFSLGAWYRQLVGESLGKKENLQGQIIETGITPTISIGTTDLHSVAQLYLGGSRDKITTFVSIRDQKNDLKVTEDEFSNILPYIKNKSIGYIQSSILQAVKDTYFQEKRPFISLILPEKNERFIGQFIMVKIFEIIFLAKLLNINAFDQPAVEFYKNQARRILLK